MVTPIGAHSIVVLGRIEAEMSRTVPTPSGPQVESRLSDLSSDVTGKD